MTLTQHTVIAVDEATAELGLLRQCADICAAVWPLPDAPLHEAADDPPPSRKKIVPGFEIHYVIRDEAANIVIAHACCFPREISIARKPLTVLALAGVCTRAEYRKQGLGSAVVRACFARADRERMPWCLFQTTSPNRRFYESLGAAFVSNTFINSLAKNPKANPWWGDTPMAYPASKPFPNGVVDLLGPGY